MKHSRYVHLENLAFVEVIYGRAAFVEFFLAREKASFQGADGEQGTKGT